MWNGNGRTSSELIFCYLRLSGLLMMYVDPILSVCTEGWVGPVSCKRIASRGCFLSLLSLAHRHLESVMYFDGDVIVYFDGNVIVRWAGSHRGVRFSTLAGVHRGGCCCRHIASHNYRLHVSWAWRLRRLSLSAGNLMRRTSCPSCTRGSHSRVCSLRGYITSTGTSERWESGYRWVCTQALLELLDWCCLLDWGCLVRLLSMGLVRSGAYKFLAWWFGQCLWISMLVVGCLWCQFLV